MAAPTAHDTNRPAQTVREAVNLQSVSPTRSSLHDRHRKWTKAMGSKARGDTLVWLQKCHLNSIKVIIPRSIATAVRSSISLVVRNEVSVSVGGAFQNLDDIATQLSSACRIQRKIRMLFQRTIQTVAVTCDVLQNKSNTIPLHD